MFFARAHLDPLPSFPFSPLGGGGDGRPVRGTGHRAGDDDTPAGLHAASPRPAPGFPGGRLNLLLTAPDWRGETWADRLPALLQPIGVTSLRARTARQAERMLRETPVHLAVVDLSLPLEDPARGAFEEAGTRILALLARLPSPPPTVVVQAAHGHRDRARCMSEALRCGAFAVVDRSAADLEFMLEVMRRCLTKFYGGSWPQGPATLPARPPAGPPV